MMPLKTEFTEIITLDATSGSDILWKKELQQAEEVIRARRKIIWKFAFGCTNVRGFRLQDPFHWNTHRLAVDYFTTSVWSKYKEVTSGICLFEGSLNWLHHLYWDEAQKEHFENWKRVSRIPDATSCDLQPSLYTNPYHRDIVSLYAIEQLSEYLHRLNAYLPEEPLRFSSFDATGSLPLWRIAQALSKERFPYILTDISHPALSSLHAELGGRSRIALCLPKDQYLTSDIGELWESVYRIIENRSVSFRVIPEIFLAEEWAEVEEIIVITDSLSEFGRRQLQGFSLSGGKTIFYGKSLNMPNAVDWNDWIR